MLVLEFGDVPYYDGNRCVWLKNSYGVHKSRVQCQPLGYKLILIASYGIKIAWTHGFVQPSVVLPLALLRPILTALALKYMPLVCLWRFINLTLTNH